MSRGRKKAGTVEEQIVALENDIAALKEEIKKKREKLNSLKRKKKSEDDEKIIELLKNSDKTKDEIIQFLSEK